MVRAINFLYSPNLNPDIFKGTNSLSFIILSLSSFILSIFAHNNSTISIPVAKQPIILDGLRNDTEWDDAFKFNFTSPRLHEGYVILYLKYELLIRHYQALFIFLIRLHFLIEQVLIKLASILIPYILHTKLQRLLSVDTL